MFTWLAKPQSLLFHRSLLCAMNLTDIELSECFPAISSTNGEVPEGKSTIFSFLFICYCFSKGCRVRVPVYSNKPSPPLPTFIGLTSSTPVSQMTNFQTLGNNAFEPTAKTKPVKKCVDMSSSRIPGLYLKNSTTM